MQLGFVIDQSRCIGCHACTVACKSENDVPLGAFRTWVKYTEAGTFPDVRRSFAVLRCNQCTSAPCVTICPVRALEKRDDGIVDVDPAACIGCKACMHACPYDALYLNDGTGTAEKCHFCAHRAEIGLAPACAVVCPTEAIIPGDFDDPASVVSRLKVAERLDARKTEAGTGPNVFYKEADQAGLDPLETSASGGFIWSQGMTGPQLDAETFHAMERKARARTVYDVAHPPLWGFKISVYLFAKSLAAGIFLVGALIAATSRTGASLQVAVPLLALIFLGVTSAVLVLDLRRPDRFWYILTRPNLDSWLARGTFALAAYGALLSVWLLLGLLERPLPRSFAGPLALATAAAAVVTAAYTGWLFGQACGRPLWLRRGLWLQLVVQALVAGSAALLVVHAAAPLSGGTADALRLTLVLALLAQLGFMFAEARLAPPRRKEEHDRALSLIAEGPLSRRHWRIGVLLGGVAPILLLMIPGAAPMWVLAALFALVGLFVEEDLLVRAGQAVPIS
ncbi:MAG: polysulfide reductase NrfD [Acidobacteriota bacterium]|nr:polysulfide reductase NrfD [Acidobacteriota bacterium]